MNQAERDRAHQTYANLVCQERLELDRLVLEEKQIHLRGLNTIQYIEARHEMDGALPEVVERIEAYDRAVAPHYREYVRKTANHFQFYVGLLSE